MTYDAWRTTFMPRKKYRIEYFIKHTFLVIHVEIFFPYSRTPRHMRDFWYRCLFRAKCAFCRVLFALFFLVVSTLIWIRRREKALDIFSCFSPVTASHAFQYFRPLQLYARLSTAMHRAYTRIFRRTWTCIPCVPFYGFRASTSLNLPSKTQFSFRGWHVESSATTLKATAELKSIEIMRKR